MLTWTALTCSLQLVTILGQYACKSFCFPRELCMLLFLYQVKILFLYIYINKDLYNLFIYYKFQIYCQNKYNLSMIYSQNKEYNFVTKSNDQLIDLHPWFTFISYRIQLHSSQQPIEVSIRTSLTASCLIPLCIGKTLFGMFESLFLQLLLKFKET